jgi:hypothetical protein
VTHTTLYACRVRRSKLSHHNADTILSFFQQTPNSLALRFGLVFCGSTGVLNGALARSTVGLAAVLSDGIASALNSVMQQSMSPSLSAVLTVLSVSALDDVNLRTAAAAGVVIDPSNCDNCTCVAAELQVRI